MKTFTISLLALFLLVSCQPKTQENLSTDDPSLLHDSHVHLMSPDLIAEWKALGIPFSRPEAYYSNIDTILSRNQAATIDLIGMGYVYENPDFYQGDDRYERLKKENDYLLATAKKYPERVRPFIAVDPLKEYASAELSRCLRLSPDAGLKLHFNASQVYLTEPEHLAQVKPLFSIAAQNETPILLHFDNWHPKFGAPDIGLLADSILQDLPALRINIAHFGTSGGFNEKTKKVLNAFIQLFEEGRIPSKHQLFFDVSAVALDKDSDGVPKLKDREFEELNAYMHKLGLDKVTFGTDYPLYTSEAYIDILKSRVGLTEEELATIMKNTLTYINNGDATSN